MHMMKLHEVLKGISCSESELTLKEGQYKQLSVSYNPLQAVPLNNTHFVFRFSFNFW